MQRPLVASLVILSTLVLGGCGADRPEPLVHTLSDAPAVQGAEAVAAPAGQRPMAIEVGCAACIYRMPGIEGCRLLAGMVAGTPRLISGGGIKVHASGLCEAARPALVTGTMVDDVLMATQVELR